MGVRIAVLGVGYLGRHHARILKSLPLADLVGIVDLDPARAQSVGDEFSIPAFSSLEELPSDLQAATVAVPTEFHASVGQACLARGWNLMVEKPLASTVEEGRALVEGAARAGVILQVGHTERYNPAYQAALPKIERPRFFEAHRLGVFTPRSLDVDVILDLMIHDLDIVRSLDPSPVLSVAAVGVKALSDRMDIANARIAFQSGCVANLTASRISTDRVRKIRLFQPESYLSIDTFKQEVALYRLERKGDGRPDIRHEPISVTKEEPLRLELESFLAACRGESAPVVSGEAGLEALELAQRVRVAIQGGEW